MKSSTPAWVWVFLIAVVALVTYLLSDSPRPGRNPAPGWKVGMIFAIATGGVMASLVGYQFYRQYDRAGMRALKKAQAGDTAGALADLRAAIDGVRSPGGAGADGNPYAAPAARPKGSAVRANMMGALHAMREEWAEAHEWFVEAERSGGRQAHYVGNQGMVLWKLGRPEEGAALLEEACRLAPTDALMPCNLGHVLIDLGRFDEARERLAKSEANLKKFVLFRSKATSPIADEVESLRKKLESVPE